MKSRCVAVGFLWMFGLAASASGQTTSYHCVATAVAPGTSHVTITVSPLIPLDESEFAAINSAWSSYAKASDPHTSSTYCRALGTSPALQENVISSEETVWKAQGWQVVHVDWKPGQAAISAGAAAAPAVAPPTAVVATAAAQAPKAPAQAPREEGTPYHCTFSTLLPSDRSRQTVFANGVFTSDESRAWIVFWWSEYIHTKYQVTSSILIDCTPFPADAATQQSRLSGEETGWKMFNYNIVRVDWAPTQTAPPGEFEPAGSEIMAGHRLNQPPPPPKPSAPLATGTAAPVRHYYYYCSSEQSQPTMYFSSAFDTTDTTPGAMSDGYKKFLAEKYSYKSESPLSCFGNHATLAEAQADLQRHVRDLRAAAKWKVVETGWTWGGTPPPPPTPIPAGMDPAVGQLQEPFRTWAINEVPGSKAYCAQNAIISGVFDCDCFARAVLHARIANAGDYRTPVVPGMEDRSGFEPLGNLFYGEKLPCTECLDDARLTKYATDQTRKSLANVIAQKGASDPSVTRTLSCAAARFVADFRAKPYVGGIQGWTNHAISTCWSKYGGS